MSNRMLLSSEEEVSTPWSTEMGRQICVVSQNDEEWLVADAKHPAFDHANNEPGPDQRVYTITKEMILDRLQELLDDEEADDEEEASQAVSNNSLDQVDRIHLARVIVRVADDKGFIQEYYPSHGEAHLSMWDKDGGFADKQTDVGSFTCPSCFMVKSMNGQCECDVA